MLPTSTDITIQVDTSLPAHVEAIVVFAAKGGRISGDTTLVLGSDEFKTAMRLVELGVVKGKLKEVDFDLLEMDDKVRRIYVVGLGETGKITPDHVRIAAGSLLRVLKKHGVKSAAVVPPARAESREALGTQMLCEGLLLAGFDYTEYRGTAHQDKEPLPATAAKKSAKGKAPQTGMSFHLLSSKGAAASIQAAADRARVLCDAQNFARTIAFRPGNDVNPPRLASIAQEMCREVGMTCRVMDEKEMKKLGMGGIVAVGAGSSSTPPRMIVMEWRGAKGSGVRVQGSAKKEQAKTGSAKSSSLNPGPRTLNPSSSPLLLVGKAITFDTGGISIKPALNMQGMIFDKCGAMSVLGAMVAIAKMKLSIDVVAILASAENHISDTAYRPGDILKMYNGVTVEVTNTDAEGRLVLGDALAWGIETYKPAAVVNLATLTGAMVIALGFTHCGVMSNNDELVAELDAASQTAGEKIWRLPLEDSHRDLMKSDFADIKNSGGRDAGSIKGGAFLSYFVPRDGSVPWCHMDVAGVADTDTELPYYRKGATGWGVRTLVQWVETRSREKAEPMSK